jgi:hypothetical protein
MSTDKDQARLLALQEKESGAWLHALPSTNLGTLLDNQCFRISICLRLGIPMCVPHPCKGCFFKFGVEVGVGESIEIAPLV